MLDEEVLHPTKPSFPEFLLKCFGNNGVLSYKTKCVSIGIILYVLGALTTLSSNSFYGFLNDYAFFVNTIVGSITFCAIVRSCKKMNATFAQLDKTIEHSKDKRFGDFVNEIDRNPMSALWYYVPSVGFAILFAIFGYSGIIGPPWVKEVTLEARIVNHSYYILWCAVMGFILGVALNRLFYYSSAIHKFCTRFVVPEKIRFLIPEEAGGLKPLGNLALSFCVACTIPSLAIFVTNVKTYIEGDPLFNRPIYVLMMVIYVSILSIVAFFPIKASHNTLREAKQIVIGQLDELIVKTEKEVTHTNPEGFLTLNSIVSMRDRASKAPIWPLNISLFIKFLTTILFPLIGGALTQVWFEYLFRLFM